MFSIIIVAVLLLGAAVSYLPKAGSYLRQLGIIVAVINLGLSVYLSGQTFLGHPIYIADGLWFLDDLGALLLLMIAALYLASSIVSYEYLGSEFKAGVISTKDLRLYYALLPIFIAAMSVAIISNHVGWMWLALEGTTLSTVLLVSFYRKKSALDAAWKYLILCSLGISLALVGVVLTVLAVNDAATNPWLLSSLQAAAVAGKINLDLLKWGFVFIFIGLGTKVGFVPMHTWLPDAHSKTPAPISAILSGVLLNVALVSLLRFKQISDTALTDSGVWTNKFFLIFGCISVVLPALVMLVQKNYKRLLAYSSIKHMGLMAFSIGLGPAGIIPAVLQMPGHALLKSSLFFATGRVFNVYNTNDSTEINDVWIRLPKTTTLLVLSLLMLLAVPPSAVFVGEILTIGFGMKDNFWLTLLVTLSLVTVSLAMLKHVYLLCFGVTTDLEAPVRPNPEPWRLTHLVIIVSLFLALSLGLFYLTPTGLEFMVRVASSLNPSLL